MTATPETEHGDLRTNSLESPCTHCGCSATEAETRLRTNWPDHPCPFCGCTGEVERADSASIARASVAMGERTDREILLNIESMMTQIRDLVAEVAAECGPIVQQISGHAMFRMVFGKVKSDD